MSEGNVSVLASNPPATAGTGVASGTLPSGENYGNGLNLVGVSNTNDNGIMMGGGNLYILSATGLTSMPSDSTIEVEANLMGVISGGFKISTKPKVEAIYNQFEQLVQKYVIREEINIKTGVVTWYQNLLSMLGTSTSYATSSDYRTVWTGQCNQLPPLLVRFVKNNPDGSTLRFTMVGQGGKGFDLNFGSKPVTIDAEIDAIAFFNNFVAEVRTTAVQGQQPTPGEC